MSNMSIIQLQLFGQPTHIYWNINQQHTPTKATKMACFDLLMRSQSV